MNMYILPDDLEPAGKAIPFMRPGHPLRFIQKGDKKGGQPVGHLQRSSDLDLLVSGAESISWNLGLPNDILIAEHARVIARALVVQHALR